MAQPLYLDYPDQAAAYAHPEEYLYGSDMLVAPVTSPGGVADTTVWIPPGRWVDYFTGATFTGPTTTTVSVPLNRMPVFVRAGGIIPEQSSSTSPRPTRPDHMILEVFSGSSGPFSLYGDSGTGPRLHQGAVHRDPDHRLRRTAGDGDGTTPRVTVGPAHGHYPGEPTAVGYRLEMVDLTRPRPGDGGRAAPRPAHAGIGRPGLVLPGVDGHRGGHHRAAVDRRTFHRGRLGQPVGDPVRAAHRVPDGAVPLAAGQPSFRPRSSEVVRRTRRAAGTSSRGPWPDRRGPTPP